MRPAHDVIRILGRTCAGIGGDRVLALGEHRRSAAYREACIASTGWRWASRDPRGRQLVPCVGLELYEIGPQRSERTKELLGIRICGCDELRCRNIGDGCCRTPDAEPFGALEEE